jgi:hypothetical protein
MTALTAEDLCGSYLYVESKDVVRDAQRLLQVTSVSLVTSVAVEERAQSIRELEGLGKDIWKDVDPKRYINSLRDEWDSR